MKELICFLFFVFMITPVYSLSTSNFGNIISQGNSTFNGTYVNITGLLYGNNTFTHQSYPTACSANYAVTEIGDSNICSDSWVNEGGDNMTGSLIVDDASNPYIMVGDIDPIDKENKIITEGGVVSFGGYSGRNRVWSPYYKIFSDDVTTIKNGTNGIFYDNDNIFCDFVVNNFSVSDSEKPRKVLTIASGTYRSGNSRVFGFINSSCVFLKLNPGWDVNLTDVDWNLKTGLKVNFNDGESYDWVVGNDEESIFKIGIPSGQGFTSVWINDKAGVNNHDSLTIHQDMDGKDGSVAQNIYMYSNTQLVDVNLIMLSLENDVSNFNSSDGTFIDMQLIGTPLNADGDIDGIRMDSDIDHLIHVGSADTIKSAYYESVNITSNVTGVGTDVTVFSNNDEYVYVGNTLNFTSIGAALSTNSGANLNFEFYYCNNSNEWESLGGVTDTSSGFTSSGSISFTNPSNRGTCNKEYDGTAFSDVNNYTYVALKRTRNFVVTKPIIDRLHISGGTDYFILQKDMLKLQPVSSPPETCSENIEGGIYYDDDVNKHCACDGTNWVQMNDYTTGCS